MEAPLTLPVLTNIALGAMDVSRGKTEKKVKIQFRIWGHFWIFCMMKKKRMCNSPCSSRHVKNGKNLKIWQFEDLARWNASKFTPVGVKRKWFFFKILEFEICEGNKSFQLYTWSSSRHVFIKNFQNWVFVQNCSKYARKTQFWKFLIKACPLLHGLLHFATRNPCNSGHTLVKNFQNWVFWHICGNFVLSQNATTHAVVGMLWSRIFKLEFSGVFGAILCCRKMQQRMQ